MPSTSPSLPLDATHTPPSLLLDATHTALAISKCQAHRPPYHLMPHTPPSVSVNTKHIALPTTRCQAHRPPYHSMQSTPPSLPLDATHTSPSLLQLLSCFRCRWCRCAAAAAIVVVVAVLLMPLRCCCRGMCCPSTQYVWVEAECVYEWMPSICMSRCRVHVWVDGGCMCEWMLSVCVSAWWMHVWVDAECMCEWRDHINALIYSISINSIAYIINKIYMTSIRIASFILVQLQCSCMHPVI